MRIQFLGAAQTVTGSLYLLETKKQRFLVDAGLFQGSQKAEKQNFRPLPFHPKHLDGIILTHAHIDHSGLIPRMVAEGYRGPIYATPATIDLCRIVLPDSGSLHEEDCRFENKWRKKCGKDLLVPLYTRQQAEMSLKYFEKLDYYKRHTIGRAVNLTFHDAGHILGSAIVELEIEGSKIVFSGDMGNRDNPILREPDLIDQTDYLVIESTYGDRLHDDPATRMEGLGEIIRGAQGPIIIPAFAVERTQELMYDIIRLQRDGKIPILPIYVDSPMAVSATEIFERYQSVFGSEIRAALKRGEPLFETPNMHLIRSPEESQRLNKLESPAIIISASGMCEGGRIRHHLYHHLPQAQSTVVFVGFQAERTLGRRLKEGVQSITLFGETVPVRAKVKSLDSYSAHADYEGLISWVRGMQQPPAYTFITHGELSSSQALGKRMMDELEIVTVIPALGELFELLPASSGTARLEPAN
ncbi:MAG TPA: MBL fold hydrolase [Cyanobacteria bacterium UBA8530]|nr:MBL fold hydrolase [Cyanobacteria bacterium UBA8530]